MNLSNVRINVENDVENEIKFALNTPISVKKLSLAVIEEMKKISDLSHLDVTGLSKIPLGKLRNNAVRLHAVCRYKNGVKKTDEISPISVRCIDIHPRVLNDRWSRYANFLLFHEFLHALGFSNHGKEFRRLEALWHDGIAREMGPSFTSYLRNMNAGWLWICPSCDIRHMRSKRSNGRYRCRLCHGSLVDIKR